MFSKSANTSETIGRPRATDRHEVLNAVIRYNGPVVNIRNICKNIHNISTQMVKGKNSQ